MRVIYLASPINRGLLPGGYFWVYNQLISASYTEIGELNARLGLVETISPFYNTCFTNYSRRYQLMCLVAGRAL